MCALLVSPMAVFMRSMSRGRSRILRESATGAASCSPAAVTSMTSQSSSPVTPPSLDALFLRNYGEPPEEDGQPSLAEAER